MQCTASPAVIPINIRNNMLSQGPGEYTWHGRHFEVVPTRDRQLRVFELDCWEPQPVPTPGPQPVPVPTPTPTPGPTPAPAAHLNPWRLASFAAIGIGAVTALCGFASSYWHPFLHAFPGVALMGAGGVGLLASRKDGLKLPS